MSGQADLQHPSPHKPRHLLGIGAHPVDDSVLIKVMLVPEGEGLSFPQLPHKDEGGALKVVPLLGHLEGRRGGEL